MVNVKTVKDTPLRRQNFSIKIDLLFLCLLIFVPRLLNLNVFLTPDEPLFFAHARDFAAGVSRGDFSLTLGIGYPGVTVAAWSAPVIGLGNGETLSTYAAGRMAMALLTGLLLVAVYALARRLLGRRAAFLGVSLLALDPFMLGYSRLLHNDATLALLITLAGLAALLWLNQGRRWWLLVGVFIGLALLTKSTALVLGPMLGVLGLIQVMATEHWQDKRWRLAKLVEAVGIIVTAAITFVILWPAMWVDPAGALGLTMSKLWVDQEAGAGNLGMFWLGQFVQDPGPAFYPVAFLLKATPWLLLGLALSLWLVFRQQKFALRPALSLWLFALTYMVIMTIASKKAVRYMLPVFPTFYLLTGLAFDTILRRFNAWRNTYQVSGITYHVSRFSFSALRLIPSHPRFFCLLLSLLFTLIYHPYYLTYYNPLVLGWRWAPQTILVGWGEGLDQAAAYLNQKPVGEVSAWYGNLLAPFYHGQVRDVGGDNLILADKTVLYINQVQRDIPSPQVIHYFRTRRQPEYTARLNGIDYAWVYPGPIVGLNRPDPAPQYALGGDFGGEARLLGYNLHPQPRSGDTLIVTLYWRALSASPADRFVYLRLVDAAGHVWAKADSPPVMGLWPSPRWQAGMLIEDAHELPILPGTPPGVYRLEVGLYDPASGHVLPASGQPVGQGGGLLLGDVPVAWQSRSTAPDLPRQTNVALAANARLIGYDVPPPAAATGDVLPLRLAWRETASAVEPNNFVGLAWHSVGAGESSDRQFNELPLPIEQWGDGAVLLSQHDVIVPPTLATGEYELRVSLRARPEDGRPPAGEIAALGRVNVTAPPHEFELPADMLTPTGPHQLAQGVTLAGYRLKQTGQAVNLTLYWQTASPLKTRYKVFAQLLAGDNILVAQSDQFPAAGQRPTTGWLPGEIITDAHSLTLPASLSAGRYRLITGLYNPLTGQRLPLSQNSGDAILVAEVTVP